MNIRSDLGWEKYLKPFLYKRLPDGTGWSAVLGTMCALTFMLLVVTGMILAFYYVPSPDKAWDSVQYISNEVPLGNIVRGLHHWSAGLMVLLVPPDGDLYARLLCRSPANHLAHGRLPVSGDAWLRFHRLSAALGYEGLLGHSGRRKHSQPVSGRRQLHHPFHFGRERHFGLYPHSLLLGAYPDSAGLPADAHGCAHLPHTRP